MVKTNDPLIKALQEHIGDYRDKFQEHIDKTKEMLLAEKTVLQLTLKDLDKEYHSLKNEKALSGYITEFSSFNVFDQDIINDTVDENNNEEVSPEDVNLENP